MTLHKWGEGLHCFPAVFPAAFAVRLYTWTSPDPGRYFNVKESIMGEITSKSWVNWDQVFNSVGNEAEALRELVTLFCDAMPRHLAAMREALQQDDWSTVAHEAHAVKGQVGFFTDDEPFLAARMAVNTARADDGDACRCACRRLELLIESLMTELLERSDGSLSPSPVATGTAIDQNRP